MDLIRFEHIIMEAALNVVCTNLFKRVRALSPAVASTLKALQAESRGLQDVLTTQVDELLPLKNKLDELRKRVKEIKRAMTDVLNNDEDMAMMYLESSRENVTEEVSSHAMRHMAALNISAEIKITNDEYVENQRLTTATTAPTPTISDGMNTMYLEMMFEVRIFSRCSLIKCVL